MKQTISLILLLAVLIIGFGSIYIINEAEQAIVTQFGKPVGGAVTDAGIHFKTPIIQTVIKFDKRFLEWDGSANEIPTLDNKYIFIDAFARWRISDALQFYKAEGEAKKLINESKGYAIERINTAEGDVTAFELILKEYKKAPQITKDRYFIETMNHVFENAPNKVIVDTRLENFLPMMNLKNKENK